MRCQFSLSWQGGRQLPIKSCEKSTRNFLQCSEIQWWEKDERPTSNIERPGKRRLRHRMKPTETPRYILSSGTQVRDEDFGLLFYTMHGPRLYFLSSGSLLHSSFFQGELTLDQWIRLEREEGSVPQDLMGGIRKTLDQLRDKGVIVEC